MPFFSRAFWSRESSAAKRQARQKANAAPAKPQWTDAWQRTEVSAEEVQELLRGCTQELKFRALDIPFLLLPFRPSSDPSAARTFIRNFFNAAQRGSPLMGEALMQELRLTEPMVLCSVVKWCWGRLPGGVVTWEAYELFKVGEQDSNFTRDAFSTFIPISVESDARTKIIFDFFDLLAALAAHGKTNGLGGRKLSRYAGWWAFEHSDTGKGFEASYKNWTASADATSHLFFAYLRSISPDSLRGVNGISALPIALQTLVQATEYPPEVPSLLQVATTRVVMIVDTVSPTPFSLLRRAKNFEYRDSDYHLQQFSGYEDPVRALTHECFRVLKCISSTNQSSVSTSKTSTSLRDASWSRFEDIGFSASIEESDHDDDLETAKANNPPGLMTTAHSQSPDLGRPTTPSWADFLSSGFHEENGVRSPTSLLIPPDKVLPPIDSVRGQSSQSHRRTLAVEPSLDPGELASITTLDLDDSFWWVWISSLSGEEPSARKAVFGRCALLETIITGAKWLVLEEQVKGAAPEPEPGAYIVEKKSFFGFTTRRGRLSRRKSSGKKAIRSQEPYKSNNPAAPASKTSIGPDQHARIQAAAAALQRKQREQEREREREQEAVNGRRTRIPDDVYSVKTNSVMTMQTAIFSEASQAMKWAHNYDKDAVRSAYLSNSLAGTGLPAQSMNASQTSVKPLPASPPQPDPRATSPLLHSPTREEAPIPKETVIAASPTPVPAARIEPAAADATVEPPVVPEPEPKRSVESMEDQSVRKLKKNASAFKGIFGSGKKRTDIPLKPTGADPSAVAAARAALENMAQDESRLPVPKAPASHRLSGFRRKPVAEIPPPVAVLEESKPVAVTKPVAPPKPAAARKPVAAPRPAAAPKDVVVPTPEPERPVQNAPEPPQSNRPPRTRRDAEYDALSRIDTNEKAMADREFSSFDQGPLIDQPAFIPTDSPPISITSSAVTEKPVTYDVEPPASLVQTTEAEVAPTISPQDRWAQIRKNAAERATTALEEARSRAGQTGKTDDGESNGEETIESRVARIKARVAELTGNMDAAR